jgi:NAD(P)-dependent dehydrogenase (short-subunit alcohol dehydrogenase family)
MLLDGKVAIVTGSTRGLGRGFAEALAAEGAQVVVNGTNEALVSEVVEGIGDAAVGVAGSVAEWDVAERLTQTALDKFGRLDILINNAGIVRDRTLMRMSEEEFDDVIAVNLKGTFACTRFAAQAMRDRADEGTAGGRIISIVSNTGLRGGFGQTNYAAAKAGVAGMIRTWAMELERYAIKVNGLWPVAVTDMTRVLVEREEQQAADEHRDQKTARELGLGQIAEVAAMAVYLASDLCALHGQILTCNGTKLALWSHPDEVVTAEGESWTPEAINDAVTAQFTPYLQTVGMELI